MSDCTPTQPGAGARKAGRPFAGGLLTALLAHLVLLTSSSANGDEPPLRAPSGENPVDPDRAMGYLRQVCAIGPRISGTPGMARQQKLVVDHFEEVGEEVGAEVELQRFRAPHPRNRQQQVRMANLIVRWRPGAPNRVLLCAHYDTRPLPDQDRDPQARRAGVFVGANDGASGTALLMELGHLMAERFEEEATNPDFGVDFALFDAEELVYSDRDPYFLGSQWFATQYAKRGPLPAAEGGEPRPWSYEAAVLLDMVADKSLRIYYEGHSFSSRQSRPIVHEVWETAERLGVKEFVPKVRHTVLDDHLALRRFGGIRAIDLIDFDYPYWHTTGDTPERCSGESMAKVGWVVWEWLLERAKRP